MAIPKRSRKNWRNATASEAAEWWRLGSPGGSTRIPTLARPKQFPKYLGKQTSSGIVKTAALDPFRKCTTAELIFKQEDMVVVHREARWICERPFLRSDPR